MKSCVTGSLKHGIEVPFAPVLRELERPRGHGLFLHTQDIDDPDPLIRRVGDEARVHNPLVADGEVLQAVKLQAARILEVTHPHAQLAAALDHEEAQRAACEHRQFTPSIAVKRNRIDRCAVEKHSRAGLGEEAHAVAANLESAGRFRQRRIIQA